MSTKLMRNTIIVDFSYNRIFPVKKFLSKFPNIRLLFYILHKLFVLLHKIMDGETKKKPNTLPIWGNERTMNLNSMILTNIQASPYFKNQLYELKTYHAVVDEIYYKVRTLVAW